MNTRSVTETPPDWTDLNNNTKAGLFQILKDLKIVPPENADRDQLIRLIRQKLTSPRLSPYKSTGMLSRPADSQNANSDDDDIPNQESEGPEDDGEDDEEFEVPPMENDDQIPQTTQIAESQPVSVESPKKQTQEEHHSEEIQEEPQIRKKSPIVEPQETTSRLFPMPASDAPPAPRPVSSQTSSNSLRPSALNDLDIDEEGNPRLLQGPSFTDDFLRRLRSPMFSVAAGVLLILFALLILLLALKPRKHAKPLDVDLENLPWLKAIIESNEKCLEKQKFTFESLKTIFNVTKEEAEKYVHEDKSENLYAVYAKPGIVCKVLRHTDNHPAITGILIVSLLVLLHLYFKKAVRTANHFFRSLSRDVSCDLDTLLVEEAGEMLPSGVTRRLGIDSDEDTMVDPRDKLYDLTHEHIWRRRK